MQFTAALASPDEKLHQLSSGRICCRIGRKYRVSARLSGFIGMVQQLVAAHGVTGRFEVVIVKLNSRISTSQ